MIIVTQNIKPGMNGFSSGNATATGQTHLNSQAYEQVAVIPAGILLFALTNSTAVATQRFYRVLLVR